MFPELLASLFFAIPVLALVLFVFSLWRYLHARRANKKTPGTFSDKEMKKREVVFFVSAFITGVYAFIFVGCIVLAGLAVAFM